MNWYDITLFQNYEGFIINDRTALSNAYDKNIINIKENYHRYILVAVNKKKKNMLNDASNKIIKNSDISQ